MREWAETNGVFIPLDDYYDAITFREPSRPAYEFATHRLVLTKGMFAAIRDTRLDRVFAI